MRLKSIYTPVFILVLALLAGRPLYRAIGSQDDQPAPAPPAKAEAALPKVYFGTESCIDCHERGPTARLKDPVCRLTEVKDWKEKDKHQHAYKILGEPRARADGQTPAN